MYALCKKHIFIDAPHQNPSHKPCYSRNSHHTPSFLPISTTFTALLSQEQTKAAQASLAREIRLESTQRALNRDAALLPTVPPQLPDGTTRESYTFMMDARRQREDAALVQHRSLS